MCEYLQWLLQWLPGEGSRKNERRRASVSSGSEKQELRLWFRGGFVVVWWWRHWEYDEVEHKISIYIRDGIFISLHLPIRNTGKRRRCRKGPSGHEVASKAAQYPRMIGGTTRTCQYLVETEVMLAKGISAHVPHICIQYANTSS